MHLVLRLDSSVTNKHLCLMLEKNNVPTFPTNTANSKKQIRLCTGSIYILSYFKRSRYTGYLRVVPKQYTGAFVYHDRHHMVRYMIHIIRTALYSNTW